MKRKIEVGTLIGKVVKAEGENKMGRKKKKRNLQVPPVTPCFYCMHYVNAQSKRLEENSPLVKVCKQTKLVVTMNKPACEEFNPSQWLWCDASRQRIRNNICTKRYLEKRRECKNCQQARIVKGIDYSKGESENVREVLKVLPETPSEVYDVRPNKGDSTLNRRDETIRNVESAKRNISSDGHRRFFGTYCKSKDPQTIQPERGEA
jgi:hypothetical protein